MAWTVERIQKVRDLWVIEGLSATQIAKELGHLQHCDDGGRSAVLSQINRLKRRAKLEDNTNEFELLSRKTIRVRASPRPRPLSSPTSSSPRVISEAKPQQKPNVERPLTKVEAETLRNSVKVDSVSWPTAEEVAAQWRRDLVAAASRG